MFYVGQRQVMKEKSEGFKTIAFIFLVFSLILGEVCGQPPFSQSCLNIVSTACGKISLPCGEVFGAMMSYNGSAFSIFANFHDYW